MTLVLNGTTGVSSVDGSAATPAIQGNDTNTGVFFPAADTVAIATNGTERLRTDSSGNVSIGASTAIFTNTNRGVLNVNGTSTALVSIGNGNSQATASYMYWDGTNLSVTNNNTTGALIFQTNAATEQARITSAGLFQFNSGYGSSAAAYGCRAWVNFNGTGTVAIRASGNVSSITDNGVGDYTVNFTNAMPDTNYAVMALSNWDGTSRGSLMGVNNLRTKTTSAVPVTTLQSANYSAFDTSEVDVSIFR